MGKLILFQEYTNEPSVDKIIETFERVENENFSIYKLLNEFCAENEVLRRDLNKIRQDIGKDFKYLHHTCKYIN